MIRRRQNIAVVTEENLARNLELPVLDAKRTWYGSHLSGEINRARTLGVGSADGLALPEPGAFCLRNVEMARKL